MSPTSRRSPGAPPAGFRAALRRPRGAALLLGAVALLQAGIGASLAASSSDPAPALTLTSDADGTALFTATQMAPGHAVTRCLVLSYGHAVSGDQLKLMSRSSGALADHMHVRIEAGTGGSAASCTGFTGAVIYSGSLNALTSAHGVATNALPVKTLPDGTAAVTVRVRFSVDDTNAAQRSTASADLVWVADALGDRTPPPPVVTPVDPPPVTPPPATTPPSTPPVTPPPATTPPAVAPDPVTTAPIATAPAAPPADTPATPDRTTDPSPRVTAPAVPAPATPTPHPALGSPTGAETPPPAGAEKSSDDSSGITQVGHVFSSGAKAVASAAGTLAHAVGSRVVAPVAAAAAPAARGATVGLGGTAPLLGAFLLIQGRIDRRDPKLASAPAYADPDLTFNDIPRGPLKSRTIDLPAETEPGSEP